MLTGAIHYLKHAVLQREWPDGTTEERYYLDLEAVVLDEGSLESPLAHPYLLSAKLVCRFARPVFDPCPSPRRPVERRDASAICNSPEDRDTLVEADGASARSWAGCGPG